MFHANCGGGLCRPCNRAFRATSFKKLFLNVFKAPIEGNEDKVGAIKALKEREEELKPTLDYIEEIRTHAEEMKKKLRFEIRDLESKNATVQLQIAQRDRDHESNKEILLEQVRNMEKKRLEHLEVLRDCELWDLGPREEEKIRKATVYLNRNIEGVGKSPIAALKMVQREVQIQSGVVLDLEKAIRDKRKDIKRLSRKIEQLKERKYTSNR